jgi:membrane protein
MALASGDGYMGVLKIFYESTRRFFRFDCFTRAAAISFYAFFSFFPILFLVFSLAGFLLGADAELLEKILVVVKDVLPQLSGGITSNLEGLVDKWQGFGWVGVLVLIVSAQRVIHELEGSLYKVYDLGERKERFYSSYIYSRLKSVAVLIVAVLVLVTSVAMPAMAGIFESIAGGLFPALSEFWLYELVTGLAFSVILPLALLLGGVFSVYQLSGGRAMSRLSALYGSIVFILLWELAKYLFAIYLVNFQYYNKFYGSLGVFMLFLLWIFYSASIFLFGASVSATHNKLRN